MISKFCFIISQNAVEVAGGGEDTAAERLLEQKRLLQGHSLGKLVLSTAFEPILLHSGKVPGLDQTCANGLFSRLAPRLWSTGT